MQYRGTISTVAHPDEDGIGCLALGTRSTDHQWRSRRVSVPDVISLTFVGAPDLGQSRCSTGVQNAKRHQPGVAMTADVDIFISLG